MSQNSQKLAESKPQFYVDMMASKSTKRTDQSERVHKMSIMSTKNYQTMKLSHLSYNLIEVDSNQLPLEIGSTHQIYSIIIIPFTWLRDYGHMNI